MFLCLDLCYVLFCFYVALEMQIKNLKKNYRLEEMQENIKPKKKPLRLNVLIPFPKAVYLIQSLSQADLNAKLDNGSCLNCSVT